MRSLIRIWAVMIFAVPTLLGSPAWGKPKPPQQSQSTSSSAKAPSAAETQKKNVDEYVALLRSNVRQQKAEIMGAVMALSAADAAKFWPIYEDYDKQLSKLNDERVENIKEYASSYDQMTDEKADELVKKALEFQDQRNQLLASTYESVKQAVGATTAARFLQVEHQLLLIIDLQITSSLPLVAEGS